MGGPSTPGSRAQAPFQAQGVAATTEAPTQPVQRQGHSDVPLVLCSQAWAEQASPSPELGGPAGIYRWPQPPKGQVWFRGQPPLEKAWPCPPQEGSAAPQTDAGPEGAAVRQLPSPGGVASGHGAGERSSGSRCPTGGRIRTHCPAERGAGAVPPAAGAREKGTLVAGCPSAHRPPGKWPRRVPWASGACARRSRHCPLLSRAETARPPDPHSGRFPFPLTWPQPPLQALLGLPHPHFRPLPRLPSPALLCG